MNESFPLFFFFIFSTFLLFLLLQQIYSKVFFIDLFSGIPVIMGAHSAPLDKIPMFTRLALAIVVLGKKKGEEKHQKERKLIIIRKKESLWFFFRF